MPKRHNSSSLDAPAPTMKPRFTDELKFPRGYVRAEFTDVAKTWAAARLKLEAARKTPAGSERRLALVRGAKR